VEKQAIERFKNELTENAEKFAKLIVRKATGSSYDFTIRIYVDTSDGELDYVYGFGTVGVPDYIYNDDDYKSVYEITVSADSENKIFDFLGFCVCDNSPVSDELYKIITNLKYDVSLDDLIETFTSKELKKELQAEVKEFEVKYDEYVDGHIKYYAALFTDIADQVAGDIDNIDYIQTNVILGDYF
jgi:hypothetical protein